MSTILEQRLAVVEEVKTWLGTPYHPCAQIKGVGVDCGMILPAPFVTLGLIPPVDIKHYRPDWALHRREERYMAKVLEYCDEIEGPPLPGDIVLWKFGLCFSHGAIVIDWPIIIHAYIHRKVSIDNAEIDQTLRTVGEAGIDQGKPRPKKFFCPKVWQ